MKDEFVKNIGVWGQRHYAYLKKHSPTVINVMRMKGTLEQYCAGLIFGCAYMVKRFDEKVKRMAAPPARTGSARP